MVFFGDHYKGITVEVTGPDGTKQTLGPFTADAAAGTYASYMLTTTGNYIFQAFYPGQTITGVNDNYPSSPGINLHMVGSKLLPAVSEKVILVVQEQPIPHYATALCQPNTGPVQYMHSTLTGATSLAATGWDLLE